jgi:hypothetical protein
MGRKKKKNKKIGIVQQIRSSGKNLNPHTFEPIVDTALMAPKIYITPLACQKMESYIKLSPVEISWLGTVSRIGGDFLIEDVFLPLQENSAASTEMSEEGLAKLGEELLDMEDGMEIWNRLRFWGHSHVRMDAGPSRQDDRQLESFMKDMQEDDSFFIRAIGNKKGKLQFTVFLYGGLISIDDVSWEMYWERDESLVDKIKLEIEEKVTESVPVHYGNKYGKWIGGTYYPPGTNPGYPEKEGV